MKNLKKFLDKVRIEKAVDPGAGDKPGEYMSQLMPEIALARETNPAPVSTLIEDLEAEINNAEIIINKTIQDIVTTNSSDLGFKLYQSYVTANHFNPKVLLENKNERPQATYSSNQIKALERDVYRRLKDPRAGFLEDLYNSLSDVGISKYYLESYWKKMAGSTNLYDSFDGENDLIRYALMKEKQNVSMSSNHAKRVGNLTLDPLSEKFLGIFLNYLLRSVRVVQPNSQAAEIDKLIKLLNQIKVVITLVTVLNTESWERFSSNLKDIYSDFIKLTSSRITKASSYAILGGLNDHIFDFLDDMTSNIAMDYVVTDIPELQDFVTQIQACFDRQLEKVEEDLASKEAHYARLEENRQILFLNSIKNAKTKQFLFAIEQTIQYLQQFKYLNVGQSIESYIDPNSLARLINSGSNSPSYSDFQYADKFTP